MKRVLLVGLFVVMPVVAVPQSEPSGKTLAATMEVYVFPNDGQDASQQSKDESECYGYAVQNTGTDPFELSKQAEVDAQQSEAEMAAAEQTGQGAGARGAVRGAAAGAVIGEVTGGDAGESAAIGAAVVGVRSRRKARAAEDQAVAQADAQAEQREAATADQLENFKKAFSVCLEANEYMVKY